MLYIAEILIGRSAVGLNRPFSYYTEDENIHQGMRVMVPFGSSKETIGFVMKEPQALNQSLEEYQTEYKMKLAKIIRAVDDEPLLNPDMMLLAEKVANYYKADLISVLSAMLPPSLKPKNSALKKAQGKTVSFVFAQPFDEFLLSKKEKELYLKIKNESDGTRLSKITAKASLKTLLEKQTLEIRDIPVSRIPEIEAKKLSDYDLTLDQQNVFNEVINDDDKVFLLQGVTGSGKTAVYISLTKKYVKEGKSVLILVPEIALTDKMSDTFYSYFKETISILNSSLSDSRKYDEYRRIINGETNVVLGTRSAIFAPLHNLGLIIIDEEHSSSYKQDNVPYYDAIEVSKMRGAIENCKVLLGSATPRIIDKARALKGVYKELTLNTRFAKHQDRDLTIVNMNDSREVDARISPMFSTKLINELRKNIENHEQSMILINRRGYSPVYVCRECHKTQVCPNCSIPLNYHKRDSSLRCHHCGYKTSAIQQVCTCGKREFITVGYGTERAFEDLRSIFPSARVTRLDSDVSNNEVRHEVLQDFSTGDTDIMIGTEIIAKGHDFHNVTLTAMLEADASLRLPTYLANEQTFDLISQFVGRAGRADKKGRTIIQTYVPENEIITMAAKQDYEAFFRYEMEERKKYKYPPYTYLTSITIKAIDAERCNAVALNVRDYLYEETKGKKFDIIGPTAPYVPYINGRHYRNILIKYKSKEEADAVLEGIRLIRLGNKDTEILINVDPGNENT